MKNKILITIGIILLLSACQNKSQVFPNFTYQTVYFSYQHPVRTITLGEDIVNTDLDNAHQCKIYATLGGVYTNTKNVIIDFSVDNSLVDNVVFKDGSPVIAMPANYYSLSSNQITIAKDSIEGGVNVQLTDAFFADSNSIKNTYVIPIKMTNVNNKDSILADKNYILYAIKYINPWQGYYLRRGVDVIKGKNGITSLDTTNIRHAQYVEYDDIQMLTTKSLNVVNFPLVFKDQNGYNINCNLLLSFDNNGNCIVSSGTTGITATGSGKFVKKGEKNSWGDVDRDAMYLQYQIDFPNMQVATKDTLVMRNRGVTMETF
ncbi:MAG TPA: DUF5627 domain-containing protein [Arachidicoccus soli]|uniref:DUF1735 domain-containing protein n=1 Tax=Arachidicoccus soli TaxID=2341117 RepID=A0A386HQH2_9BACT|nr:DUF5627 domain-containing protein [Arachidicoccus soli]AYD48023.1 DUF1735 domain-containing protein [Arachidicoccus soli]HEU0226508.1 DUF5627 domain-containing protein [Arachidicoccus soli]